MSFKKKKLTTPQQNAGWGLIFRLNDLWKEVEGHAPKGDYEMWNFKLDRIWCNLLYRELVTIERDKKTGKILTIELCKNDLEEKDFLDNQISKYKNEMKNCKNTEGKIIKSKWLQAKSKHYASLMLKDVWLRKFMNQLDLYLQEIEFDPSKAIYGGR